MITDKTTVLQRHVDRRFPTGSGEQDCQCAADLSGVVFKVNATKFSTGHWQSPYAAGRNKNRPAEAKDASGLEAAREPESAIVIRRCIDRSFAVYEYEGGGEVAPAALAVDYGAIVGAASAKQCERSNGGCAATRGVVVSRGDVYSYSGVRRNAV